MTSTLLNDCEAFLRETGMGETYFGKLAANNPSLMTRLRGGRDVLTGTEEKIRNFMTTRRSSKDAAAAA